MYTVHALVSISECILFAICATASTSQRYDTHRSFSFSSCCSFFALIVRYVSAAVVVVCLYRCVTVVCLPIFILLSPSAHTVFICCFWLSLLILDHIFPVYFPCHSGSRNTHLSLRNIYTPANRNIFFGHSTLNSTKFILFHRFARI